MICISFCYSKNVHLRTIFPVLMHVLLVLSLSLEMIKLLVSLLLSFFFFFLSHCWVVMVQSSLYILGNLVSITESQHFLSSEIQLKSPNWLFGQRKHEDSASAPKVSSHEIASGGSQADRRVDGLCDLNWLSSASDTNEEEIFQRYIS